MANKNLFKSLVGKLIPATDAANSERAPAYRFTPKHALAQYAATGCMNSTFYADAAEQLSVVLSLCETLDAEFVAKLAVYARERGQMKDVPALLLAVLSRKDRTLFERAFPRVVDNARMLRTFVQIVRSGVAGRKSLGTLPKRMVREWLDARDDATVFAASVGQSPSLADVVKMVHPKPRVGSRAALYGYIVGREHDARALPEVVREYEAFKSGDSLKVPRVPFQMLTPLPLTQGDWAEIARRATWQTTRMNLNTFARHGVFEVEGMTELVADRLRDPVKIAHARVLPYQLMAAYVSTGEGVPREVREALHDALEIATANVPAVAGKVFVCPDVSGSMHSPVTGHRAGATTAVRCVDVAALVAASILRKNPSAEVLPFEHDVVSVRLNARDTVLTNAERLAKVGGGGTNCSAPLRLLNARKAKGDLVIYVSDNESWVDAGAGRGTATLGEWERFRARNPAARLVCIDVQPNRTTQAQERKDVLNIGGFSDRVFEVVSEFAAGRLDAAHWIGVVEATEL